MALEATFHLSSLSVELVLEITSYLEPIELVNLALTCSYLHRQVKGEIQQFQKYFVTSDLSPSFILDLLEPESRCTNVNTYVRHLEIWGSRRSWEDWSTWRVLPSGELQPIEIDHFRPQLGPEEISKYLDIAKTWWNMPDDDINIARDELASGGDGFIKMLLFASYHHLESIKFVKRGTDHHTSLGWLTKAVEWSRTSGNWPPGFQSLNYVAVGIVTGTKLVERVDRRAVDLAAILNLPNIENVYFRDLSEPLDEDDEGNPLEGPPQNWHLPEHSSSVKHLFLDSAFGLTDEFSEALFIAPKALETIAIRGCGPDGWASYLDQTDIIVGDLVRHYEKTLQSLILYHLDTLHGYRCATYNAESFHHWSALKQFTIDMQALELHPYRDDAYPAKFIEIFGTEEVFPMDMEAMMIYGGYDRNMYIDNEEGLDWFDILDDTVVALIDSKQTLYENLQVIYIDSAERGAGQQHSKPAFQKAIAAGREAGVHVHTLTNQDDGEHWKRFPGVPDKFDLETGPFGRRPATWKVNRFTGIWEEPDCEGCGKCEECLRVYPEHVWKSLAAT